MAEAVVDVLEAVDVELHHGKEVVVADLAALHGLLDAVQAQGAVGQVGQGVVEGAVLEMLFGVLASGGVFEYGGHLAGLGAEGDDGEMLAHEAGETVEADGLAGQGGLGEDVDPVGFDLVRQPTQAVADDLLGGQVEETGKGRIDVEEKQIPGFARVSEHDFVQGEAVEHGVEEQPVLLLAFLQGLGGGVLVEGDLDGHVQVSGLGGLDDVAEGFGDLGPAQGFLVIVAGQENDGDLRVFEDGLRRFDAVDGPVEEDVHEDQ